MRLVISAVNLVEGGPLTVLRELVGTAAKSFPEWDIYVLVNEIGITGAPGVVELAFPQSKRSWSRRLWTEWFGFMSLSRRLRPDVWLSLQDITPRVLARRQYVYCQNPSPFCDRKVPAERHDAKFVLFRRFYGYLYGCFIHRNAAVIVQQEWLRRRFVHRYGLKRVIVAHPTVSMPPVNEVRRPAYPVTFLYPAFPRVFKNFEVLGECLELLEQDERWQGTVVLTIDGEENSYSREIRGRFGSLRSLRFVGLHSAEGMAKLYDEADAVVFPSLLETWGLPLTEAKARGLGILAANLDYALETIGTYARASYFDPADPRDLARRMLALHLGDDSFQQARAEAPPQPFVVGWEALLEIMLVEDERRPHGTPVRPLAPAVGPRA